MMKTKPPRRLGHVAAAILAAVVVAGCGETDRPLSYQPGVYQGVEDTPLSDDARSALEGRVALQGAL